MTTTPAQAEAQTPATLEEMAALQRLQDLFDRMAAASSAEPLCSSDSISTLQFASGAVSDEIWRFKTALSRSPAVAPGVPAGVVWGIRALSYDMDGLTLAQRLDKEEAEHTDAVVNAYDENGPGIMPGDVEGMFTRIRDAAGLNSEHDEALDARLAAAGTVRADALEEAARIVEAEPEGVECDRFSFDGRAARNAAGHDTFISTQRVSDMLRRVSSAIRAAAQVPA